MKIALFIAINVILGFLARPNFSEIHKTDKKKFVAKQKNTCLIILNDKPNCQVPRIVMNLHQIFLNRSENDSVLDYS
jgi:hypothetical protein